MARLAIAGLGLVGLSWTELGGVGPGRSRLDWTRLVWIGLGLAGLDLARLYYPLLGGERFDAMSCWPSSAKLFYGECKLISIKC